MAVRFFTDKPKALLQKFDQRIEQEKAKGGIDTWRKKEDGTYTHTSKQWRDLGFFRPELKAKWLAFVFTPIQGKDWQVNYGYYHGHLIQVFFQHFLTAFTKADVFYSPNKPAAPTKGGKTPPAKAATPTNTAKTAPKPAFKAFVRKRQP